ncbi:hypothetical protein [Paludisphaera borealis]|uniref:Uncharacterized protein n=1 Tax=Paludisphaera borealis TaxID=1387353 RepID=A0A1U7CM52_9BACT|nr:hypothetical protein [Paludisphaera borealis]APW60001.1 hypothetical protein BSF38_01463 [Paludisphaera borealis]
MTDAPATLDAPSPSPVSPHGPLGDHGWFVRTSNWIAWGALLLGAIRGVQGLILISLAPGVGLADFLNAVVGAGYDVVAFGLGGLVVSALVRALGVWAESKSSTERIQSPDSDVLVRALSRLATTHDGRRPPEATNGVLTIAAEPETEADARAAADVHLAEIRRLTREGEWDAAEEGVRSYRSNRPDDPRGLEASDELERAMQAALDHWEAKLQAARSVNDPDQVLEIHARMQPLVEGEKRQTMDVDLARWFLVIVHRRLRGGRIQPDVVALADRIADSFGHTKEGASLRAALPTLRRSAGLCPRCAKPYTGLADACAACLITTPAPPATLEPDELDEPPIESREPDWFADPSGESAA